MYQAFSCSPTRRMGVLAAVLVLAGCGGGGGEEASAPAVPLAAAFANFVNQAASYQIAYAGTASTGGQQLPFSGSGAVTEATTASISAEMTITRSQPESTCRANHTLAA